MKNAAHIGGLVGLGLVGLALSARNSGRSGTTATEDEVDNASMGFSPPTDHEHLTSMAQKFHEMMSDTCTPGTFYPTGRGDIMLGKGQKSIAWRALFNCSVQHGADEEFANSLATDTARKVSYINLVCACPYNATALTDDLRANEFRTINGYGVDLNERPILWLPPINAELLVAAGVVAPDIWEEDHTSTLEVPPELRDFNIPKD